ncbi:MAG TPA: (2Fe-2S)-binding protein, partial [Alcanivorax sp.]|nr:(2Fe-2S)-binding protein [Alcanivorax sp.]
MQAVCKTEDIGEESAREFMVGEQSVIVV